MTQPVQHACLFMNSLVYQMSQAGKGVPSARFNGRGYTNSNEFLS